MPAPSGNPPGPGDEELERRWAALRARLAAAELWLRRQGSLSIKQVGGRRYVVLRHYVVGADGRRTQESIHVGAEDQHELVRRTRALLAHYRSEERWLGELEPLARLAGRASRLGRGLARDGRR